MGSLGRRADGSEWHWILIGVWGKPGGKRAFVETASRGRRERMELEPEVELDLKLSICSVCVRRGGRQRPQATGFCSLSYRRGGNGVEVCGSVVSRDSA